MNRSLFSRRSGSDHRPGTVPTSRETLHSLRLKGLPGCSLRQGAHPGRMRGLGLCLAAVAACAAVPGLSQPPANDLCADAIPLFPGVQRTMSTARATSSGDPRPLCVGAAANGIWYTFQPPADGLVTISTCGSDFDTVLQVYTGQCDSLTPLPGGCNDDNGPGCPGPQASVRFYAESNTVYRILAGGRQGQTGNLRILATFLERSPNDLCADAIPLVPGLLQTMNTSGATSLGDPRPSCASTTSNGVWFTFVPPADGIVTLSTCGSDFDTVLQVYTGDCQSLTPVVDGCNNNDGPACIGPQASVRFYGKSNTVYRILAGGYRDQTGNLQIVATLGAPLPNDLCAGAIPLLPGQPHTLDTAKATSTTDPPRSCRGLLGNGVWYTFVPPSDGVVTLSTCGSDFDTVLQVYTGECDSLVPLEGGCNDDLGPACPGVQASVQFYGTANTVYRILAGGFTGQTGRLQIQAWVIADVSLSAAVQDNRIVLSWPSSAVGFTLVSTTNLGPSALWTPVPPPYPAVGDRFVVTNSISELRRFYRLQWSGPNPPGG